MTKSPGQQSRQGTLRLSPDSPIKSAMSRQETKEDLLAYLEDSKVQVVALKGQWGTGKTFLWDEIKDDVDARAEYPHLYASLFAASGVSEAKQRLVNSALRESSVHAEKLRSAASAAGKVGTSLLKRFVPAGEPVAEVLSAFVGIAQSSMVEAMLSKRLIVLDDIERRGSGFSIDEVMGFVDSLKRNGCTVLLILNEEPVAQAAEQEWAVLKEKCLDRELTLITSAGEAAELGLNKDLVHRPYVVDAMSRAGVTNIRVAQRIDRTIELIFGGRENIDESVVGDLVPAAAIMTAIYFDPRLVNATLEEIYALWHREDVRWAAFENDASQIPPAQAAMMRLHMTRDLDFLALLHRHVTTGARLRAEFGAHLRRRHARSKASRVDATARRYLDSVALDPGMKSTDFILLAEANIGLWSAAQPDLVNGIVADLRSRGAENLADTLATRWAEAWRESPRPWGSNLHAMGRFDSRIREAIAEVNESLRRPKALRAAVEQASSSGWSNEDIEAINGAGDAELDRTLRELDVSTFAGFIHFYASELARRRESTFAVGVERFLAAARRVLADPTQARLAELLRMHLGEALNSPGQEQQPSEA